MLAQLERTLPRGDHWRYEPKLDGFRGLLWHGDGATAESLSRNVKDLSAWFPELIVAGKTLPSNTLVDGEIVIADDLGGSDFGALQARLGMARRDVSQVALERPAVLLCFDLLTVAGEDLTSLPLRDRRHRLEDLVPGLMIQTDDWQIAQDWLTILTSVEGVVAKRADGHCVAGRQRSWIKVKRQRTIDCVVIGIAGDVHSRKLVVALTHGDGALHHLGRLGGVICHLQSVPCPSLPPSRMLLRARVYSLACCDCL